ncbi:hypothetical protein Syun_018444 [Stephania yunnanensis]|uniref:HTH myb-type domain-containing protein n=1 Tax=Stephania yunnanensis TaxID=152371 RepID=A0AAP0IU59_9MAGN
MDTNDLGGHSWVRVCIPRHERDISRTICDFSRMIVMESGKSRDGEVVTVRKGPWMAEEDDVLMDYEKKYGPRD